MSVPEMSLKRTGHKPCKTTRLLSKKRSLKDNFELSNQFYTKMKSGFVTSNGILRIFVQICPNLTRTILLLARLESAYSLIWGSRKIWGKGGGDTLAL